MCYYTRHHFTVSQMDAKFSKLQIMFIFYNVYIDLGVLVNITRFLLTFFFILASGNGNSSEFEKKNAFWNWPSGLPYFSDCKTHLFPQIWEEIGDVSYSPNVAYLAHYRISALRDVIKYFTTFFASKFFFPIFLL